MKKKIEMVMYGLSGTLFAWQVLSFLQCLFTSTNIPDAPSYNFFKFLIELV